MAELQAVVKLNPAPALESPGQEKKKKPRRRRRKEKEAGSYSKSEGNMCEVVRKGNELSFQV